MTRKINIKSPKEDKTVNDIFLEKQKSICEQMCLGQLAGRRSVQRKWEVDGLLQHFDFYKRVKGLAGQAVKEVMPPTAAGTYNEKR